MRQPAERKPAFSVATLRKAIPKHCWERSLLRSSAYLAGDLAMLAVLVWASFHIDSAPVPAALRWLVLWPLYWFFSGAVATGIWVSGASHCQNAGGTTVFHPAGCEAGITYCLQSTVSVPQLIVHICGHQAFSESHQAVNSSLLPPPFPLPLPCAPPPPGR